MKAVSMRTPDVLTSLCHSLDLMARWGCRGFACSDHSLAKLASWTSAAIREPEKDTLDRIQADLGDCTRCRLCNHRRYIMFGEGSSDAELVFVGRTPTFEEDRSGKYYAGPAGQLLQKMIAAMKLSPQQVFICHLIKCRPPDNHQVSPDEYETCRPFLQRQLAVIKPKVICTLGEPAAHALLDETESIQHLRGRFYNYSESKVMPTLDPAHLISQPETKRMVWDDLKKIMAYLGIPL